MAASHVLNDRCIDCGAAATEFVKEETRMSRTPTVHHCSKKGDYAPGAFESCIHCNPPSESQLAQALEYYLERAATEDEVNGFRDALTNNPDIDIAEYVEAVRVL